MVLVISISIFFVGIYCKYGCFKNYLCSLLAV